MNLRAKTKKKNRSFSITGDIASQSEKGKMMEDENKEENYVDMKVYKEYLGYYGGYKMIIMS